MLSCDPVYEQTVRNLIPYLGGGTPNIAELVRPLVGLAEIPLAKTPCEVAWSRDHVRLLRYRPAVQRFRTPILFVYSLINRYTILDFLPGRSLIGFFQQLGYPVYCIDWGTPRHFDRDLTWDDHLHRYLDRCVRVAQQETGSAGVSLYGYCMGGTMAVTYAALHPEKVSSFIAQATPVDFHQGGILARWTEPRFFDVEALVDAQGNVPVEMMEGAFRWMDPLGTQQKWRDFFGRLDDREFVTTFLAMEKWAADNIPFPGETYRQYIRDCYQNNSLIHNEMVIGGRRVDLGAITCPLLTIIAERDGTAPPASSEPLAGAVGSRDCTTLRFPTGHVGLISSSKSPRQYWPQIADWLAPRAERSA